jgi:hypothetical protein
LTDPALPSAYGRKPHNRDIRKEAEKKRGEILRAIAGYEERIAQAQGDLAHLNATITLFASDNDGEATRPYVNLAGLFKRGEMVAIAKTALANGPQNTRQLSAAVLQAKGFDPGDRVLAKAIGHRLIHALRLQARGGKLVAVGRHKAAHLWRLPDTLV